MSQVLHASSCSWRKDRPNAPVLPVEGARASRGSFRCVASSDSENLTEENKTPLEEGRRKTGVPTGALITSSLVVGMSVAERSLGRRCSLRFVMSGLCFEPAPKESYHVRARKTPFPLTRGRSHNIHEKCRPFPKNVQFTN